VSLWGTLVQAFKGKDKGPLHTDPGTNRLQMSGKNLLSGGGTPGVHLGGQPLRPVVTVGLAVLLGAVIVAVVPLATDSGGGGKADSGSTHAAGAPASSGSPPAATPTTATVPLTTRTTTAPVPTTTTPTTTTPTTTTPATTTSTNEGVIP
jgi:hypothetical protein